MAPVGAARRVGAAPLHALWLTGKYAALWLAAQARPGAGNVKSYVSGRRGC